MATLMTNKEIFKLNLAITTCCNFRCRHCFVKKTNEIIDFNTAKIAVNLFVTSPGRKKLFIIYGGEPLLYIGLFKRIILYTERKAKLLKKEVRISFASNGTLCNPEVLSFLHNHNVKFCLSLDGDESVNIHRRFKNGRSSFDRINEKIPLITKLIPRENISVLSCVAPKTVSDLFKSYVFLVSQGLDSINLEPVENMTWPKKSIDKFIINFRKIKDFILKNVKDHKFFFLNSVNRALIGDTFKNSCPFYRNIEVYPSGDMTFSPFLMNIKHKEKYLIGNINKRFYGKFANCKFNRNDNQCNSCWSDYTSGIGFSSNLYEIRNVLSLKLAQHIQCLSKSDSRFKRYIKEAKKRRFE